MKIQASECGSASPVRRNARPIRWMVVCLAVIEVRKMAAESSGISVPSETILIETRIHLLDFPNRAMVSWESF